MDLDRELSALMKRAQDGDRLAYQALLIEVVRLVKLFARKRLRHAEGLEDIAQETLLSIHRDRHSYDPARPFLPWMYAITRHRLLDFVEKQRRRAENEVPHDDGLEVPAENPPVELGFLTRAFALLSIRQREIIRMLKVEGLSVAEISRKTGLSQSLVKVTAHRGYKTLRKLMVRPADAD